MKPLPRDGDIVDLHLSEPLARLLALVMAEPGPTRYLVGGPVRDLLLGLDLGDLDFAVAGDAIALAQRLARRAAGEVQTFATFGTARVELANGQRLDFAALRRETYHTPAALPQVAPADLARDLERRDFTINAMALELVGPGEAILRDPWGGRRDLQERRLRHLYRGSFRDDPTRLWRGCRFASRLALGWAEEALEEAHRALAEGVMARLSGRRLQVEVRKLLEDRASPEAALAEAARRGVLASLHGALPAALVPARGRVALAHWQRHGAGEPAGGVGRSWQVSLGVPLARLSSGQRQAVVERLALSRAQGRAFGAVPSDRRWRQMTPHQAFRFLAPQPPERRSVLWALAGAAGRRHIEALPRLTELAEQRLTGAELVAAGCPPGAALGRLLAATEAALVDGRIEPEEQLQYALERCPSPDPSSPA